MDGEYGLEAHSRSPRDLPTAPNHPITLRRGPPLLGKEGSAFSGLGSQESGGKYDPSGKPKAPRPRGRRGGPERSEWWGGEAKMVNSTKDRLPPPNPYPRTLNP